MCKYVRREIRSLTDEDRNRFFDAIETLMFISTDDGKSIYGNAYYDKNWFIREHMYGGAEITCDHWHAGVGFMSTHVAFTLQWEKALQSVDPSVTAHYWDFTIERETLQFDWRESSVFTPDWFGSTATDEGILTEGRWAYTPVMLNAQSYSGITNAWNLLRSPWNSDPRPYLTRFESLFGFVDNDRPRGCADYWFCLNAKNWVDLGECMNTNAHGRIHQLIGGSWGGKYYDFLNMEILQNSSWRNATLMVDTFLLDTEAFIKKFWRAGYLLCPAVCAAEVLEEDCQCFCDFSMDIWENKTAYDVLVELGILDILVSIDKTNFIQKSESDGSYILDGISEEDTEIVWSAFVNATCQPGYIGTMYEGESPNDVTFWVIHTTMDRLWHWMRLSPYYYGFNDTWVNGQYGDCLGHYKSDIPGNFTNLFDHDNQVYTNIELYEKLHPLNENLPYVYDNFIWTHCEERGYNFTNMIYAWQTSGITTGGHPYFYKLAPNPHESQ